jgi:hypothetical protein
MSKIVACTLLLFISNCFGQGKLDTARIDEIMGDKGKMNEQEGVYKVSSPRNDIKVSVDKWQMPPFMGLGSWAAFKASGHEGAMVMGDTVLLQDEVNHAMSAALDNDLEVTALHNHFFYDDPKIYFMHIGGHGDPQKLARGVRAVWDKIKEVRASHPQPADSFGSAAPPSRNSVSSAALEKILGAKGEANNGMFKAVFGRTVKMHSGEEVGKEMGVNTWAAFGGTDEDAIVDGDFVVLESELQPCLKSLRNSGIYIVAIHHHMTGEEPRTIFFHYWGRGAATELATAVATAMKLTKTAAMTAHGQ